MSSCGAVASKATQWVSGTPFVLMPIGLSGSSHFYRLCNKAIQHLVVTGSASLHITPSFIVNMNATSTTHALSSLMTEEIDPRTLELFPLVLMLLSISLVTKLSKKHCSVVAADIVHVTFPLFSFESRNNIS